MRAKSRRLILLFSALVVGGTYIAVGWYWPVPSSNSPNQRTGQVAKTHIIGGRSSPGRDVYMTPDDQNRYYFRQIVFVVIMIGLALYEFAGRYNDDENE